MTGPERADAAHAKDAKDAPGAEMPFLDHLEELRWRLVRALAALVAGVVAGYVLVRRLDLIGFLARPMAEFLPAGQKLMFTSPMQPFMITLKLAFVTGLVLASPVVIWQLWGFLRPALYQRERRVIAPVALAGLLLFSGGAAAAFTLVLPLALKVMLGFAGESLTPLITAHEYFSFATTIIVSFGAVFELPLALLLLVYLRIISAAFLRKQRRTFLVVNAILSSVLTPGDIVIMTAVVMVPVQLFYELSIVLAMILERRRARAEAAEAAKAASGGADDAGVAGAPEPKHA